MRTAGNLIIAMLPTAVTQRIERESHVIRCEAGHVLIDAGEPIVHVYFPIDAVVTIDQVVDPDADGPMSAPGLAVVGNEGSTGIERFFGAEQAIHRATVRIAGSVQRVDAASLYDEFARAGALHRLLLRSADALLTQVGANAACDRIHPIEQRLIRWLLLIADRHDGRELALTQSTLAHLLAVRRVSITAAAALLQLAQDISYRRGHILIRDRPALESKACNCYRQLKGRYDEYVRGDDPASKAPEAPA